MISPSPYAKNGGKIKEVRQVKRLRFHSFHEYRGNIIIDRKRTSPDKYRVIYDKFIVGSPALVREPVHWDRLYLSDSVCVVWILENPGILRMQQRSIGLFIRSKLW
jgi:hypothetical protein